MLVGKHSRAAIVVWATLIAANAAAQSPGVNGLGDYVREVEFLVDTPGTTHSVAGGLFNPGAWAIQPGGGLFLGWSDVAGSGAEQWAGVLSARHAAFGFRQWDVAPVGADDYRIRDYTIGLSGGTRSCAGGLSYGWGGGDLDAQERHERLTAGGVLRTARTSLASSIAFDLERADNQWQVDAGLRPIGPRLTLFADAVYRRGESFDDIRTGYGAELRIVPGLALAGKARSSGEFSFRLDFAPSRHAWVGARPHLDDGGDRAANTYAVDFGPDHASLPLRLRPRQYSELELRGSMAYQRYRLFDRRRTLLGTLARIEAMAADPDAGGVLVNLSGARMNAATAWELRAQLSGLRAEGKKVLVYCDRPGLYQLLLASVADEIWLDPVGLVDASGLASGRTYMRHAMDKLGLGVDEWRFFTYKSAFETYSRDTMSDPEREQRQELVDEAYTNVATAIESARGIDRTQFDGLVDRLAVLRPDEAQSAGLVDSIGDFAAMRRRAPHAVQRPMPPQRTAQLGNLLLDPVWRLEPWGEPPTLAVLYATGPVEMDTGLRGRAVASAVRKAARRHDVEAIVLRVDSPGGDVLPSDLVGREVRAAAHRKPVIASQGQVAASGGYWISMYADTILATPFTITGSIGVIGGWIWNKGFGDKVGLDYDGVKRGAHADVPHGIRLPLIGVTVPDRPLTAEERDRVEQLVRGTYADFVSGASAGRGLPEANVEALAQGRVWSGTRAVDNGLVDAVGGLWDGLQMARAAAGIAPDRAVQIVQGPEPGVFNWRSLLPWRIGALVTSGESDDSESSSAAPVSATLAPWMDPAAPPGVGDAELLPAAENALLESLLRHNGRPLLLLPPLEIQDGSREP